MQLSVPMSEMNVELRGDARPGLVLPAEFPRGREVIRCLMTRLVVAVFVRFLVVMEFVGSLTEIDPSSTVLRMCEHLAQWILDDLSSV